MSELEKLIVSILVKKEQFNSSSFADAQLDDLLNISQLKTVSGRADTENKQDSSFSNLVQRINMNEMELRFSPI